MEFVTKLCYLLEEHDGDEVRWAEGRCGEELRKHCGHHLTESLLEGVRLGKDKTNLTECLASAYGLTPAVVAAAAPPKVRLRPYLPRESIVCVCVCVCVCVYVCVTCCYYYYYLLKLTPSAETNIICCHSTDELLLLLLRHENSQELTTTN